MQKSYKEIFYGIAFGVGAAALDTLIDTRAAGESFFTGLTEHPGMIFYRCLFVIYGVIVGGLLWKNNQRERDMRQRMESLSHFHQQYEAQAVVIHTNLQLLLTKSLPLPHEAESLLRKTYEESRDLESVVRQRPSL